MLPLHFGTENLAFPFPFLSALANSAICAWAAVPACCITKAQLGTGPRLDVIAGAPKLFLAYYRTK